jgi:hypothetical protein
MRTTRGTRQHQRSERSPGGVRDEDRSECNPGDRELSHVKHVAYRGEREETESSQHGAKVRAPILDKIACPI